MPESIHDQVQARMAAPRIGHLMMNMLGNDNIKPAPLQDPPIENGICDVCRKMLDIVKKDRTPARTEYGQFPCLLRRLRHLLRVYYDANRTRHKPAAFKFCDEPDMTDVALNMHEVGLYLRLRPTRFHAILRAPAADGFGTVADFVLADPLDVGAARVRAQARLDAVARDAEADDGARAGAEDAEDRAAGDLAAYQFGFFVGDVLVACATHAAPADADLGERAMERLVELSTRALYRQALGDALTESMKAVYCETKLLLPFARLGGLPALYGDWTNSNIATTIAHDTIAKLPSKAWDNQTPETLALVMKELVKKTQWDKHGEAVVQTPPFINTLYQIFLRYGSTPFTASCKVDHISLIIYFLHRRLTHSKDPARYRSRKAFTDLVARFAHVPRAVKRRHGWMVLNVAGRWDCINLYGCARADTCPEMEELRRMEGMRVKGRRDEEAETRLYRWGAESKMCARCRQVSYCSATCQRAHWPTHKAACAEYATKTKEGMDE